MSSGKEMPESRKLVRTRDPGIYKRGNRYVVIYRDHRGRQHKKSAANLKLARAIQREKAEARANGGREASKGREPFASYARAWIASYQGRTGKGIRPETRAEYKADLELYAIPFFRRQELAAITPQDVADFLEWCKTAPQKSHGRKRTGGLSPASVRNAYAPVRAMFAEAVVRGHLTVTPCAGIRVPAPETGDRVKALTAEQARAVVAHTPERWRLLIRFLLDTGLRISEAVALNINSVDWDTGEVRVRDRIRNGQRGAPKSRRSVRTVRVSPQMLADLTEWRDELSEQADDAALWQGLRGHRVNAANLYRRTMKPAARAAGVEWAGFHTLRHTAATRWIASGINPATVSALLGHATPAFTLSTYVSTLPDNMPSGADLAGEY